MWALLSTDSQNPAKFYVGVLFASALLTIVSWWAKEGLDNPSSANYGASNVAKPGQMIIKIKMLLMMMVATTMKMTDKLNNPSRANYGGRPPCQNLSGQSDKPPVRPPGNNQSMLHSIRWHSFNFQSIHTHSKLAIGLAFFYLALHALASGWQKLTAFGERKRCLQFFERALICCKFATKILFLRV